LDDFSFFEGRCPSLLIQGFQPFSMSENLNFTA